jgi:hypothetical protein
VPNFKHPSLDSARQEAERLARMSPGQEFAILESLAIVVKDDLRWERTESPEPPGWDIPF